MRIYYLEGWRGTREGLQLRLIADFVVPDCPDRRSSTLLHESFCPRDEWLVGWRLVMDMDELKIALSIPQIKEPIS